MEANNIRKSISFLLIIILFSLMISSAYAIDNNETDMNATDDIRNFTEFNQLINDSSDFVSLTNDYLYFDGDENAVINKSLTIEGNNHNLTFNSDSFKMENGHNILLKDINFIILDEFLINSTSNITFYNCHFELVNHTDEIITEYTFGTRGNISKEIVKLAKSIVGNSKDLEAAKKLAKWVGKNIEHETREGFYQNASETLKRKYGNCCSQTELFLQMCEAIGITKNHKVYFVHVGTIQFKYRHFFAIIDNICVDVDARPTYPWGHARIGNRTVYSLVPYPLLPLQAQYN